MLDERFAPLEHRLQSFVHGGNTRCKLRASCTASAPALADAEAAEAAATTPPPAYNESTRFLPGELHT